ncbi:MAG TPA: low temperature requirement protein A [Rugosimonospora sp.]|nr:low temperature requirement protein A [Rugosimonospora sp.]
MTEARRLVRPMRPRSRSGHRVATPLELLFDLCFVVAVAQASDRLHHALIEGEVGHGLVGYLLVFFAVWWAWMNFTWFASAYDTDDVPYRLAVFVQIAGVLVLAAGVPRAFDGDIWAVWLGYLIMRFGLVALWLRAARQGGGQTRGIGRRYALGIGLCQVGWLGVALTPQPWTPVTFAAMALVEMAVPIWAERHAQTTWHPHHIAERYGLLTLIVLGETVLSAVGAVEGALTEGAARIDLVRVGACGLVIVFAMWWVYFDTPAAPLLRSNRQAFPWGYGHYFVFTSAAAVGAGLGVTIDHDTGHGTLGRAATGAVVAVPVAVYLLAVGLLHLRPGVRGRLVARAYPVAAALVLLGIAVPGTLAWTALVLVAVVALLVARPLSHAPEHGAPAPAD